MPHDLSKQPKWVRDRIERLENSLAWARDRLADIDEGTGRIVHGTLPDDKLHLPDGDVEFQLVAPAGHWGAERRISVRMAETVHEGPAGARYPREVLEVRCDFGRLAVEPMIANGLRVYALPK